MAAVQSNDAQQSSQTIADSNPEEPSGGLYDLI